MGIALVVPALSAPKRSSSSSSVSPLVALESAIRTGAGRAWNAPGAGAAGVTLFDGLLGALVPMALVAVTANV